MITLKILGCIIWLACGYLGWRIQYYSALRFFYIKYGVDIRKDYEKGGVDLIDMMNKQKPISIVIGFWHLFFTLVFNAFIMRRKSVWRFEIPEQDEQR